MPKLPRPSFRRKPAGTETEVPPLEVETPQSAAPQDAAPTEAAPDAKPGGSAAAASTPPASESPSAPASTGRGGSKLQRPTPPSLWPDWVRRLLAALAVLLVGGIGFAVGYLIEDEPAEEPAPGPAPTVVVESAPQPEAVERIGFPEFATRNTTRVGGADAIANGAGVALASFPSLGGVGGPQAAILAPADSWQEALAATPLTADPIAAPLLLSGPDEVPPLTSEALAGLAPQGLEGGDGVQLIAVGDVAVPDDLETLTIDAADPAEIAKAVDAERARLSGTKDPDHILVVSSSDAGLAMPAAAWAARSGDPILFADGDQVPEATLKVIRKHPDTPVYVLGPETAISGKALRQMEKKAASVTRTGNADDPVESSIDFARFVDGDFGWNINDPGHGFVIAAVDRPLDAAVAAPLSAGGKPGPLLVTTDGESVPPALQGFLADTKPGFIDDPTRAVYNHVWLLGDSTVISVGFQAQIDELTELAPVTAGTSTPDIGAAPGAPEDEPAAAAGADQSAGADAGDGDAAKDDSTGSKR